MLFLKSADKVSSNPVKFQIGFTFKDFATFVPKSISIPFANQLNYYKSLCPDEKFKLSNDELKLFKKD